MRTLCVDTSTTTAVLAVVDGDRVVAERRPPATGKHGETLLVELDGVLRDSAMALNDVELLAVGVGPGSFTGVRVALATAKGLAMGCASLKVAPVSTLEAIATTARREHDDVVVAVIDAHKDRVYAAAHAGEGALFDAVDVTPEALVAMLLALAPEGRRLLLAGTGVARYREVFEAALRLRATFADDHDGVPSGLALARLARRHFEASGPADVLLLEPTYVRPSDATIPALVTAPFSL